jgi:hypothetical protein
MTDCTNVEVRDALPDIVHGTLGEGATATMLAHVESCEACAAELALLRSVHASAPQLPRVDVERIVAALPPAGSGPRITVRSSSRRVRPWLAAAAAAAIIATTLMTLRSDEAQVADSSGTMTTPVPEAPVSATPRVESIQPRTPVQRPAAPAASLSLVAGVQDLSDSELESLIAELDGIDSVPSEEPLPLSPVGDIEGEG